MTGAPRIDLHVHSSYSPDSRHPPGAFAERLAYSGMNGFALTDHNTVAGHARLPDLVRRFPSYVFVPGVEISTSEGHLLAYGVRETPPAYRSLAESVDWVRGHGGIAILAHPCRWTHGVGRRRSEEVSVDGLEAVNGHNGLVANARAELIGARRRLVLPGGGGAHAPADLGRGFTQFTTPLGSAEELLTELKRGHTEAGGVSLTSGERLGWLVQTAGRRALRGFRRI